MKKFLIVILIIPTVHYRTNTRIYLKPVIERGITEQKRFHKRQGGSETAKNITRVHEADIIMNTGYTAGMSFGFTQADERQARHLWYDALPKIQ